MKANFRFTRRDLLATAVCRRRLRAAVRAGACGREIHALQCHQPEGQKMLASYAKGVDAMLKLPADHPQNWFRNAFTHLMDCPHGNWWFYVWHRGYLGYLRAHHSGDSAATTHLRFPIGTGRSCRRYRMACSTAC